jgi:hypothetical protein
MLRGEEVEIGCRYTSQYSGMTYVVMGYCDWGKEIGREFYIVNEDTGQPTSTYYLYEDEIHGV